MTIKELTIFCELAKDYNVSKTAKRVGLSQSAVSLSIKSLEGKIGEALFDRIGKKLVLNERGSYFYKLVYPHLKAIEEAKSAFKKELIAGEVSLASSRTIGDYLMPIIAFDFMEKFSGTMIYSKTTNSKNIVDLVKNGNVGIGFIEYFIDDKELYMEKLCEDELIIATADANLKNSTFFIDQLQDKTWLLREKGSGTRETFLDNIGDIKIGKTIELMSFESIKTLLLNKPNTLTCISKICIEDELKRGDLYEVKIKNIDFKRAFYLLYHKKRVKNRLFLEFINFAKRYFITT